MSVSAIMEQLEIMKVLNAETHRLMEEREMLMKNKEALNRNLNSAKESLAIAKQSGESAATTFKELLTTRKIQIEEKHRLKKEYETLKKNIAALSGDLSSAKKYLANGKSSVTAHKQPLRNVRVKIEETDRLKEEKEKIKLAKKNECGRIISTQAVVKKMQTPAIAATPQATKCLEPKKNLKSQSVGNKNSSGIPENKCVKDDVDRSENSPDRSSDDCDSDASNDSDLELLDCFSHDPIRLYEAIMMKKSGTHCEGVTIKQEPAD